MSIGQIRFSILPRAFAALLFPAVLAISGCGGRTMVQTTPAQPNPTPTSTVVHASAGAAQTVTTGNTVTLDGSATSPAGVSFQWTQSPSDPIQVTLSNAASAKATFTAPLVVQGAAAVPLNFQLKASSGNVSDIASTTVTISGRPLGSAPALSIVTAQFQTGFARTKIVATSDSPGNVMTASLDDILNPDSGQPVSGVMSNTGSGTFAIIFTGLAQVHHVTVKSSAGGAATTTAIQVLP